MALDPNYTVMLSEAAAADRNEIARLHACLAERDKMNLEFQAEIERLRGMLGRYSDLVGSSEGVDFLDQGSDLLSSNECLEIRSYSPALTAPANETGA